MTSLTVDGFEIEISKDGTLYIAPDDPSEGEPNRMTEFQPVHVMGTGKVMTPELRLAVLGMRDQCVKMVRAFWETHKDTLATMGDSWTEYLMTPSVPAEAADGPILIFTDGACSGNPGPGGWGAIVKVNGEDTELSGSDPDTTSNRMEMMAAIEVCRSTINDGKEGQDVQVK